MTASRSLIVNADDFGQSPGVNRGIVEAHTRGIVTSASLMVRWPAAAEAVARARVLPHLSLGLHVDLCEWVYREGIWEPIYEVISVQDRSAVEAEAEWQLAAFRWLVGRNPTHLDSHQHVHRKEPVYSVVADLADRLRIPLRHYSPFIRYCGDFYGQTGKGEPFPEAISVEGLLRTLTALAPGVTELGCHPGIGEDLDSMYVRERAREVQTLCDPRVGRALKDGDIELRSFASLAGVCQ